jgi:hypothetical protein
MHRCATVLTRFSENPLCEQKSGFNKKRKSSTYGMFVDPDALASLLNNDSSSEVRIPSNAHLADATRLDGHRTSVSAFLVAINGVTPPCADG